jgi:hypothetical protein
VTTTPLGAPSKAPPRMSSGNAGVICVPAVRCRCGLGHEPSSQSSSRPPLKDRKRSPFMMVLVETRYSDGSRARRGARGVKSCESYSVARGNQATEVVGSRESSRCPKRQTGTRHKSQQRRQSYDIIEQSVLWCRSSEPRVRMILGRSMKARGYRLTPVGDGKR